MDSEPTIPLATLLPDTSPTLTTSLLFLHIRIVFSAFVVDVVAVAAAAAAAVAHPLLVRYNMGSTFG